MTAHDELRELRDILERRRDDLRVPIEAENAHDYCVLWSNGLNEAIREIDRLLAKPEAGDREKRIEAWRAHALDVVHKWSNIGGGSTQRREALTKLVESAVALMREGGAPADGEPEPTDDGIEPDTGICDFECPGCRARIEVLHGDEVGEVSVAWMKDGDVRLTRGAFTGSTASEELVAAAEALHYTAQCTVEAIRCVDGDDEQRTERRWRAAYSLEQKAIALGKALAAVRARGGKNDGE